MPKPLLCNPKPFKDQFRRDTRERRERRYCFILGAGASVSSGIMAGKAMADQWLRELYERQCPSPRTGEKQLTLEEWCVHAECPVPGVDPKNPGAHYPQVFLARYPGGDPEGQRFIQEAMHGKDLNQPNIPSIGYAYLALLLQQTDSRVVITTNFDNLVADSLLLFTGILPRVVGHERVATFAGLRDGQPLIAKIHGDVGFVTTNDPEGVSKLSKEWHAPLRDILRNHIPVFIGYDGNDGSLMDFLCAELFEANGERSALHSGLYWCYRAAEGRDWLARLAENPRLKRLADVHQVHFVPIGDFDLWMMELGEACGIEDPEKILRANMERRIKGLNAQLSSARASQATPAADPAVEASRAGTREEIAKRLGEWDLVYKARSTKDPAQADEYFRSAINLAPSDGAILASYAFFLKKRALEADLSGGALGERLVLLDQAQELHERALKADPNNATNLAYYAILLSNVRKDFDRAEEYYKRALKADPNNPHNLGNYAAFLGRTRKEPDQALELYKQALAAAPNDATILGNYAVFLENVQRNSGQAEQFYERALAVDPNNANNLSNYAVFLTKSAEDPDRAEEFHKKALSAASHDANNIGNYAGFLLARGREAEGLRLLDRALEQVRPYEQDELASELWFYALAHRPVRQRAEALSNLKKLILQEVRSPHWDLLPNAQQATQAGHPDAAWLARLAAVIRGSAEPSTLKGWPAWVNAKPRG